jgi:hypothetical protein
MSFFGGIKLGKISLISFFFEEKNLVWNQRLNTFNQKLKKIQYQLFVWQNFWRKWPKKNVYQYIYQIDIYWKENEKNGLYNGKKV